MKHAGEGWRIGWNDMMYAPMNSRQQPVSKPQGDSGAVTMDQRPVYQPQPANLPVQEQPMNRQPQQMNQQAQQQMNGQVAPRQPQPTMQYPQNQMPMNQRQGNQMRMNPMMRQNRQMGNGMRPGMGGGMQQQGGGLLGKILSNPMGSINKLATIMKLLG